MNFTDTELVKYIDGTLSEDRAALLEEAASHDEELASQLRALDASQLPYKAAFARQTLPPIPRSLKAHVADLASVADITQTTNQSLGLSEHVKNITGRRGSIWTRSVAVAACVGACIALGYWLGAVVAPSSSINRVAQTAIVENEDNQLAWVERVTQYQSLYVDNTVKHIVPDHEQASTFLDAVAQRTGMLTHIPDFSKAGYQFVRAQELGYDDKPLIQLVYSKPGAAPLALCYMPSNENSSGDRTLASYHGLSTISWMANGQRFVIVGSEGEKTLEQLYTTVSQVFL